MIDEQEETEELGELEVYEPQGVLLDIEQCFILDAMEFAAEYNTNVARYSADGKKSLEVLDKTTGEWIDVTLFHKRKRAGVVKAIKPRGIGDA